MKAAPAQQIHTIDWRAEAWLSGTSQLGPNEGWLYVTIINLIYAHGEAIDYDLKWIGRQANMHGRSVRTALAKLIKMGKVWQESDGKLMAKRCETELETARKRISKWIEKGGNLGRPPKDNNHLQEAPHTAPLARTRGTTNHQPPVSGSKEPSTNVRAKEDAFEAWWEVYPHKVGKRAARDKFLIALRTASLDDLIAGVKRYIDAKPPDRSWCNPATWLHQERWQDQPAPTLPLGGEPAEVEYPVDGCFRSLDEKWTAAVKHWREGKTWLDHRWGPKPGEPGCQIPSKYLIEEAA